MKRSLLDQAARDHHLTAPDIALALDLTGARPDAAAWSVFTLRLLNVAGIAALGAGIIFFVAANWQDYGVMGRFAILQVAFVACIGFALWRPPPHPVGQASLVLATLVTGTLLALFGQSYQTGADLYELFFVWALLALPFALAGRSGAVWATWWGVLNVALALYCGLDDMAHFRWVWLSSIGIDKPLLLLTACTIDLAGAALFVYLARTRFADHAPHWLARMLATLGFLFGTAACLFAITHTGGAAILVFAVACALIAVHTLRSKDDVFPMALIAASWITISTVWIVKHMRLNDLGSFFLIALWLIGTSTAAGFLLMRWVREWRK